MPALCKPYYYTGLAANVKKKIFRPGEGYFRLQTSGKFPRIPAWRVDKWSNEAYYKIVEKVHTVR